MSEIQFYQTVAAEEEYIHTQTLMGLPIDGLSNDELDALKSTIESIQYERDLLL